MSKDQIILTDQFGRVHDYLRISLTERCNLRCFYCMPEEGIPLRPRSEFMSKDEIVSITNTFVGLGVKKIRLTGGEPLVRSDANEIIHELSKLPVELAITTNGILVDKFIATFKSNRMNSINVSLDSLQEEKLNKITRRNYFKSIFSNIQTLIKENFHVKLNAVIMRGVNDDEIIDFIEFTKDNNVHFRFIEFMPFDGNKWNWSKGLSYKEMMGIINGGYKTKVSKIEDKKNDTAKNYQINGYKGTFAVISSVTNPFCDNCNRIRLTADGKLKNCLFSGFETDLLTPLREGIDIRPLIAESIWKKKAKRAGMNTINQFSASAIYNNNRSMVAIGG
ncbi:MAG: GTP 3',8-cyclase MoaA [Bacteroidetes bacterium]|nr:GTP 3',8-cyclase MoaA [Bacteroidota bacterium]